MARKRQSYKSRKGFGQAGEIALFVESDPDLAKKHAAVQVRLVEAACKGISLKTVAPHAFEPIVDEAVKRLHATPLQRHQALITLTRDFLRHVEDCRSSPFCNLSPQAEKLLVSDRCKIR